MEPNEIAKEQNARVRERKTQQELDDIAQSESILLSLDDLDTVAGGAGGSGAAEIDGQVVEVLPNAMFQVQLNDGGNVRCHLSGRLRMNYIRILPGDRVRVQTSSGDPSNGRIVSRYK